MTFDEDDMRSATDKALFDIQKKQFNARVKVWLEKQERNDKVSTDSDRIDKLSKIIKTQIEHDPRAQEVIIMSASDFIARLMFKLC